MKKIILMVVMIVLVGGITACSGTNEVDKGQEQTSEGMTSGNEREAVEEQGSKSVDYIDFEFKVIPETFEIQVTADGKTESISNPAQGLPSVSDFQESEKLVTWNYGNQLLVSVEKKADYLDVTVESKSQEEAAFTWPLVSGEAYMLPLGEGKYIKSGDPVWKEYLSDSELKGIESLSMQFFGVEKSEYNIVYIIKNPYNNTLAFDGDTNMDIQFTHEYPSITKEKEYGFRIYVTGKDVVDAAKTYRDYLIEQGTFITLAQKAKQNSNIEKLYGAPHVYFWDRSVLSKENVKWNLLKDTLTKDCTEWMAKLLNKEEDGAELASAFVEIQSLDYVDNYTKDRILKAFSMLVQNPAFYHAEVFKEIPVEADKLLKVGIDNLNAVELISLNKYLLKSILKDAVEPVDKWAADNTVKVLDEIKGAGIDRLWIGLDDWREAYINPSFVDSAEKAGYLIAPYDSYHSIHEPGKEQWITALFKDTSLYENATVTNKKGEKIEGFQSTGRKLNPVLAMPSVTQRVSEIMDTGLKFNSWFLDTDATGEVFDDYSPAHITTEKEDIQARIERMKYLQNEWNLVVGSEGGNDFAAGTIAFAHGIETPSFTWMDEDMSKNKESEYYVGRYYSATNGVPELFAKQIPIKEKYKKLFLDTLDTIPLYKLVYNDSVITSYWWGLGTLKFADEAENRMLYEVLYNVPPMYHLDQNEWAKDKEQIINHVLVWSEFSKKAISLQMTDFKILSEDRTLQMTRYGTDLKVVANFSEQAAGFEEITIPSKSLAIISGQDVTLYTPQ